MPPSRDRLAPPALHPPFLQPRSGQKRRERWSVLSLSRSAICLLFISFFRNRGLLERDLVLCGRRRRGSVGCAGVLLVHSDWTRSTGDTAFDAFYFGSAHRSVGEGGLWRIVGALERTILQPARHTCATKSALVLLAVAVVIGGGYCQRAARIFAVASRRHGLVISWPLGA